MPNADFSNVVRQIVADEIEATLAPYRDLLDQLIALQGGGRRRGRPPGRSVGPRKAATPTPPAAKNLKKGTKVRYRQGRGEFEAEVIKLDEARGVVTLLRSKDSKKIKRPAAKVYQA
jgi:hypothetical protein